MDLASRAPIGGGLQDVEQFLVFAQTLKALTLQLQDRRSRRSRLERSLEQQIETLTHRCSDLAHASPRVAELWAQTQRELSPPTGGR